MSKCLTKCFKENEEYIHPTLLKKIKITENSCASIPSSIDKKYWKKCDIKTESDKPKELIPTFYYSPNVFLLMYEIHLFGDLLGWLEKNNSLHMITKERVVNQALEIIENDDYEKLLDMRFVNFFIENTKYRINVLFNEIKENIGVQNDNIIITKKYEGTDHIEERKNFVIETFLNVDEIVKFLTRLIEKKDFLTIHTTLKLKNAFLYNFIEYVKKKINLTL